MFRLQMPARQCKMELVKASASWGLRGTLLVATIAAFAPWGALAEDNVPSIGSPAPEKRTVGRRNDAYQSPDTGPGLGTLSSRAPAQDQPYAQPSAPSRVGAAPQDDNYGQQGGGPEPYTPRYGEPVRPYSGPAPAPQAAPTGGYAPGNIYGNYGNSRPVAPPVNAPQGNDAYRPTQSGGYQGPGQGPGPAPYQSQTPAGPPNGGYQQQQAYGQGGGQGGSQYGGQAGSYGQTYGTPSADSYGRNGPGYEDAPGPRRDGDRDEGRYSSNDILTAGHRFFGSTSQGLASVVENAFRKQGRPNGYILGEEAGGAFVAGLRYGEGVLYTRDAGQRKVYWQGPSVGFDVGGAGSKVMVLVYNMRDPNDIYERFGGIDGSAYVVGGIGMTLLTREHITLAPIRTGIGLRLGANVGYLKFTPRATWNPF